MGKPVDITHAAKLVDVSETQLRRLNPGLQKKTMHPNGPFHLLVPVNSAATLKGNITQLPTTTATPRKIKALAKTSSAKGKMHVVKAGDTLPRISKKYNVKMSTLLAKNNLKSASSIIHPDQKIIIAD